MLIRVIEEQAHLLENSVLLSYKSWLMNGWMEKLMVPGLGGMKDSSVQAGQWYELANIHLILK